MFINIHSHPPKKGYITFFRWVTMNIYKYSQAVIPSSIIKWAVL